MFSLVAYDDDSNASSEYSDEELIINKDNTGIKNADNKIIAKNVDDDAVEENNEEFLYKNVTHGLLSALPKPQSYVTPTSSKIIEEDDEFLHKTANDISSKVKITIPSLQEFENLKNTYKSKQRQTPVSKNSSKLLSLLPKAKSELNFIKTPTTTNESTELLPQKSSISLIPDSVRLKRPAQNLEVLEDQFIKKKKNIDKLKTENNKKYHNDENDDGDDENLDFFSLNTKAETIELPQESLNELNAQIAKRSAKISNAGTSYIEKQLQKQQKEEHPEINDNINTNNLQKTRLDMETVQILAGHSAAKRGRFVEKNVQVLDINSTDVLPSREEWMRTALASSTSYQPTGVLTDEENEPGTRRKHQITYLAHKAKANEAELQAMWSSNRHARRATQSRYGF